MKPTVSETNLDLHSLIVRIAWHLAMKLALFVISSSWDFCSVLGTTNELCDSANHFSNFHGDESMKQWLFSLGVKHHSSLLSRRRDRCKFRTLRPKALSQVVKILLHRPSNLAAGTWRKGARDG